MTDAVDKKREASFHLPSAHDSWEQQEERTTEGKTEKDQERKISLDQKIAAQKAENEKRFFEELNDLEKNGDQKELEHFFVINVLAAPDTADRVQKLRDRRLLGKILPEIADEENMPLSARLYPKKNALDQSLHVLRKLDEKLQPDHFYFQNPRSSEKLIRLAALLNRSGMHTDPNLETGGLQKWINGQPVYHGYEQMSAIAMKHVMERLNESGHSISGAAFFSRADIDFGKNLVRQHNQLRFKLSRKSRYPWPKDIVKRIKDWSEAVYDTDALNHRLDFSDTTEAHFLLQQAEIEGLKNSPFKKELLDRTVSFSDQLQMELPYFERRMKKRTIHPMIDGIDLEILGIQDRLERDALIEYVIDGQLDETLTNREQALQEVMDIVQEKMGRELQEETVNRLMERKRRMGFRMENMEAIGEKRGDEYSVRYFHTQPIRQFPETVSPKVIKSTLQNGNYPDLESYFHLKSGDQPAEATIQKLLQVGFSNLDQIEAIIRRDPEISLEEIQKAASPLARHVEVVRDDGQKIILENGYQAREHKGEGRLHISHQRYEDLMKYFRKKGSNGEFLETEEDAVNRFFEEGLIPAAGNPLVEITNARKYGEGSTIAFHEIGNSNTRQFCGVILVGKSPYRKNIVTSLFSPDEKELRKTLRFYLKKTFQTGDIPEHVKNAQLDQVNFALKKLHLKELSVENVKRFEKEEITDEHPSKHEPAEELLVNFEDLKNRGFAQKEIGRIIGFFQEQKRKGEVKERTEALEILQKFTPGQAGSMIQKLREEN